MFVTSVHDLFGLKAFIVTTLTTRLRDFEKRKNKRKRKRKRGRGGGGGRKREKENLIHTTTNNRRVRGSRRWKFGKGS